MPSRRFGMCCVAVLVGTASLVLAAAPAVAQTTTTSSSTTTSTSTTSTSTSTSTTTTTTPRVPLSKAEYIAQADGVCAAGIHAIDAIPAPATLDEVVPQLRTLIATVKQYQAQLRALVPPAADEAFIEEHLLQPADDAIAALEAFTDEVEAAIAAGDQDRLDAALAKLEADTDDGAAHDEFLRSYGFQVCGGSEEVSQASDAGETAVRAVSTTSQSGTGSSTAGATLAASGRALGVDAGAGLGSLLVGALLVVAAHYQRRQVGPWDLLPQRPPWRVAASAALHRDPLPAPARRREPSASRFVL